MKTIALAFSLLAAAALAEEGFTPLFNGRDLAGWVNVNCAPETFTVREGMLHCDGLPTGALRTTRMFENFVLELEWRHLKPGGNAGVFVWSGALPALGQPFLRAIEVQVLENAYGNSESHTTHGDVFAIHGATMQPFAPSRGMRSFPKERRSKPSPEWNHYRITCENGTLRLAVNGAEVSGGEACVWRKGYLALESEGGAVDWRNLKIKELPGGTATPEQTAPAADDAWRSLYDGRSLRGWKNADAAAWKPNDWQLAGTGTLWSERTFAGDFDFRCDFVVKSGALDGKGPVVVRAGDGAPIALAAAGEVAKGWHRLELARRGGKIALVFDGKPAGETAAPAGALTLALAPGDAAVNFASVFAK